MRKLFKKASDLRKRHCRDIWDCPKAVDVLHMEYQNIPKDIIKWFIVRHANDGEKICRGIEDIDARKIVISQIKN